MNLSIDNNGDAMLTIVVRSKSRGGAQPPYTPDPTNSESTDQECVLSGIWQASEQGLTISFPRHEGDSETYECRPAIGGLDTNPDDTWQLSCVYKFIQLPSGDPSGPLRSEGVLSCETRGGTPWIWNLMLKEGRELMLGDVLPVSAEASYGDTIEGVLIGPNGRSLEPEHGPLQWFLLPRTTSKL